MLQAAALDEERRPFQPAMALTLYVARRCTVEGSRPDGARPIARMCSEAKASVPGWVAAARRLGRAMLTIQSVFDWVDLRSYDIREPQGQMSHLRPGAITPIHSNGPFPPCQGIGNGRDCYPLERVRKRSVLGGERYLSPISAVSLLSRAFSGCRKVFERHSSRWPDQEKGDTSHTRHAYAAGEGSSCSWR